MKKISYSFKFRLLKAKKSGRYNTARRRKKKFKPKKIPIVLRKSGLQEKRHKAMLDYKNIPVLRQYLTVQGKILPRRRTGLTAKQQRKVAVTIKTARVIACLPFIRR